MEEIVLNKELIEIHLLYRTVLESFLHFTLILTNLLH